MSRVVVLALGLATALAGQVSAAAVAAPAPPLVLGLLLPPDESRSASIRQGALTAIDLANAGRGPRVSLAVRGKTGPWGSDASEAALLVMDDGAEGLIAPPGGAASHLLLQVSGRTAVPVVSLCSDTSVTTASLPWMVRVAPSSVAEAEALFRGTAAVRWLAFVPTGRAGREAASDLRKGAASGKRMIAKVIESGDPLPQPAELRKVLSALQPDGVLLWLDAAPAGRLARALREAGCTAILAGPMKLDSAEFFDVAGRSAEAVVVPSLPAGAGSQRTAFVETYRRLFHAAPDSTAALAHDAALILIDRIRRTQADESRGVRSPAEPLLGATGSLDFDRHGNRLATLSLARGRGGRFVSAEEALR